MFQLCTAADQTSPDSVTKNNFLISHNFLAQEIWQFGWVIFPFHVALLRSLGGIQLSGGLCRRDQVGFTHMSSNLEETGVLLTWELLHMHGGLRDQPDLSNGASGVQEQVL